MRFLWFSLLSIFCRDYQVYSDLIIGPKLNALVHFHFVLDLKILNSAVAIFHTKRLSSIFNWFFYQYSPIWCLNGAEVSKSEQIRVHRALDGGQFRFLVKFESSVLCTLEAYIGHLGYFIPHLMNKKADFGFKVLKKWTSKTEKMRKCPKTANFGHVLVY